jgi:formylglycine-generating enzyme required for sulfatase activity
MSGRDKNQSGVETGAPPPDSARHLAFATVLVFCILFGIVSGYGAWRVFGSHARVTQTEEPRPPVETTEVRPGPVSEDTPTPTPTTTPTPATPALPGLVEVGGGEVMLGGGQTGLPLRRVSVDSFAIAETEVTNEQYKEFVTATGRRAPAGWQGQDFPEGAALMPVTNVSWHDAVAFCKWLSEKTGQEVALPSEAEWELAARGPQGLIYPWGNEWNERAAVYKSQARPVKSFPEGRSPCGAYDMAGNVWEWVADQGRDEEAKWPAGTDLRVIKGGSAEEEEAAFLSAVSRHSRPVNRPRRTIGFRYVVRRKTDAPPAGPPQ